MDERRAFRNQDEPGARCAAERRETGERRRSAGLLEVRARREGNWGDRRRDRTGDRARRRLKALWQRVRA